MTSVLASFSTGPNMAGALLKVQCGKPCLGVFEMEAPAVASTAKEQDEMNDSMQCSLSGYHKNEPFAEITAKFDLPEEAERTVLNPKHDNEFGFFDTGSFPCPPPNIQKNPVSPAEDVLQQPSQGPSSLFWVSVLRPGEDVKDKGLDPIAPPPGLAPPTVQPVLEDPIAPPPGLAPPTVPPEGKLKPGELGKVGKHFAQKDFQQDAAQSQSTADSLDFFETKAQDEGGGWRRSPLNIKAAMYIPGGVCGSTLARDQFQYGKGCRLSVDLASESTQSGEPKWGVSPAMARRYPYGQPQRPRRTMKYVDPVTLFKRR